MSSAASRKRRSSGFTLLEIMVAIAIVGMLTYTIAPQVRFMVDLQSEQDTKTLLKDLVTGMRSAYKLNVDTIDGDPNAQLNFGARGTVLPTTATGGQKCNATVANFTPWSEYAGQAATTLQRDAYGAPLCIFINPRSQISIDGVDVYYHSVAFVSGGRNNVLDVGTVLDAQGNLTLAGDDLGALFDGRSQATERYTTTVNNMRRIVSAYEQYYASRYSADPYRNPTTNYFACGDNTTCPPPTAVARWDPGGTMPTTCAGAVPLYSTTGVSLHSVLGLTRNDVIDGFGKVMTLDNCTDSVRSPNNTIGDNMRIPPYTAAISTTLPGGQVVTQAAISPL